MKLRTATRSLAALSIAALAITATPALACGGLVDPNGTIRLARTSTLAAYHAGIEHYITSFEYQGGSTEFGSIIPLPARPTRVDRGGDWTLQRLSREVRPVIESAAPLATSADAAGSAKVILETKIDALDITVLQGGTGEVIRWAREHDFRLSNDAPKVLNHYAKKSKYFLAARFDARRAAERNQATGQGTPIHVQIPMKRPWVPLHILTLGKSQTEIVDADVFVMTARRPRSYQHGGGAVTLQQSGRANESLMNDLRSDQGMDWMPPKMWLSYYSINGEARSLSGDLTVNV